jgi:hypothetical protein
MTGLEIIRRQGLHPAEVIIEANLAYLSVHQELVDALYRPPLHQLRTYQPLFRRELRPINVILNWSEQKPATPALDAPLTVEAFDPGALAAVREANAKLFHIGLLPNESAGMVRALRRYIDYLERGGTKVVFMEMPADPAIRNGGAMQTVLLALIQAFPPDRYEWIEFSALAPFTTADGLHLLSQDATRIARKLRGRSN